LDKNKQNEIEDTINKMWKTFEERGPKYANEQSVPANEAKADRRAIARRIGRLYLAFARIIMEKFGEREGKKIIMEAIRDYSYHCAEVRKKGQVDLPARGIHEKMVLDDVEGQNRLRMWGCGIAEEFMYQGEEKLGALYCLVDPCSVMFTKPNIKLIHEKMVLFGDESCEFNITPASDKEMNDVTTKGNDYIYIDTIIAKNTTGLE
jgi:hypothetical protein